MKDIYIIDGLRTAIGRRGRSLKNIPAVNLAAIVIRALIDNNKLEYGAIDEVILGNAVGAGLGQNPARQALLQAGLPSNVPAFTVNKVCGSGLKCVILGAQAIACEDADVILAGGTENVSQCPQIITKDKKANTSEGNTVKDSLINDGLWCSFADSHMGMIAEYTAERFKISRESQDSYAMQSYKKACAAKDNGSFRREIVSVQIDAGRVFNADERPRPMSIDELSRLRPAFKEGGSITAGNSPSPADGSAVLILASEAALKKCSIKPLARILGYASAAVDPKLTFTAPALAVKKCLKAASISMSDVDLFEINEAFAVQALLTAEELGIDAARLNIFGGTIAMGHPLGASGARGLVTLLSALTAENKKIGVTCVCLGGGCAVALAVRMLN